MPRPALCALAALVSLAALAPAASGQDRADLRRVVLVNGDVFVGTVADETADPLVVVTEDGVRREFARGRVERVAPLIRGRFFRTDPVRTSLFVGPTARTQGTGQVRVGLTTFVPTATVGVSDRVDLTGAGAFSFGTDGGGFVPLVGVKGAVVAREGLTVALGASAAALVGSSDTYVVCGPSGCDTVRDDNDGFLAVPYGAVTVGDETRAFTAGVAGFVGGIDGEVEIANGAGLWAGAEVQVNNGVKLIGEALTVVGGGDFGLVALPGVRLFGNRFAFDIIGFVSLIEDDGPDALSVYGFAPVPFRASYTF
jgi:hypothetical protein